MSRLFELWRRLKGAGTPTQPIEDGPGRTIAIGDIHGCAKALETLLGAIEPESDDVIIALGDYIDRGPDSKGVIDQLLQLQSKTNLIPLLGNHESMMLNVIHGTLLRDFWLNCGGRETLESYGGQLGDVPTEHVEFLRSCLPYHETQRQIFVHANYHPQQPLNRQSEGLLLWEHIIPHPPAPHRSGKIAFVGHTPQVDGQPLDIGHLVCIDTFCFGDGLLTAMEVNSREMWQADKEGVLQSGDGSSSTGQPGPAPDEPQAACPGDDPEESQERTT